MAALTHKGSVVGASSTTGDSVGYNNTDSGLQSTNVQDAIDEIIDGLGSASNKDVAVSGDASATQVVMGNDSRLSDARPASDVSAWAKASTKPSYTAAEVGAIASTDKGANGGVAELDSNGKVPASQLPLGETSSTVYAGNKGKANADAIAAIKDGSTIDSFSDVETALSGKQNTLTFDDVPTDNSNNPVKSNGVYDALAVKQDATDNNLQTTAKTVVGSINEVNGKADDLSDVVSGETKTVDYASVITVNDAMPVNADVTAKIEPVQNLHGYDKPWAGGAGKNLIPMTVDGIKAANSGTWSGNTITKYDVTYTILTDNDNNVIGIKANGTASSNAELNLVTNNTWFPGANTYTLTGGVSSGVRIFYYDGTSYKDCKPNPVSFTLTGSETVSRCTVVVASGSTANNDIFYPMIRVSTETDAAFAPYTNICPISGRDNVKISRTGKNLFDKNAVTSDSYLNSNGEVISNGGWDISDYIPINGKITYTGLSNTGNAPYSCWYDENKNFISSFKQSIGTKTITPPNNAKYVRFSIAQFTGFIDIHTFMVSLGEYTALTYESFGNRYTIDLNGTRYGGTLHIDNNGNAELLVDRAYVEFNGDGGEKWSVTQTNMKQTSVLKSTAKYPATNNTIANVMSDKYKAVTANNCYTGTIGVAIDIDGYLGVNPGYSMTITEWQAILSNAPLQVVYELANPFTVSLSPAQIQLLKGQNTIYADSGDIKLTYETGLEESVSDVQEQSNDLVDAIGWSGHKNLLPMTLDNLKKYNTNGTWNGNVYTCPNVVFTVNTIDNNAVSSIKSTYTGSYADTIGLSFKLPKGTYTMSSGFEETSGSVDTLLLKNNTVIARGNSNSPGQTFTLDSDSTVVWNLRVTARELTAYPMIRKASDTDPTFQPYHPVIGPAVETLLSRVPTPPTGEHAFEHYLCADGTWTEALPPIRVGSSGTSGDYSSTYYYTRFGFVTMLWVEGIINKWDYDQVITICSPGFVPMGAVDVVYGVGVYDSDYPPTADNVAHFYMENGDVKIYCEKEMHYGRAFFMFIDTSMS